MEQDVAKEIIEIKGNIRDIKETMATKGDINSINSTLDKILTIVTKVRDDLER